MLSPLGMAISVLIISSTLEPFNKALEILPRLPISLKYMCLKKRTSMNKYAYTYYIKVK